MIGMRMLVGGLLLALGLAALGCAAEEIEEVVVVADVKDEFYLDFWEDLSSDGRTLEFRITTIEEEECQNAMIDHRFNKSGNEFSISLQDIRQPADCNVGKAPARANIDAGNLNLGYYVFTIDLKNTVFNEGELTLLSDRYLIRMEAENGVRLVRRELFRVPDGMIWGYAHYESSDDRSVATRFIGDIKELGREVNMRQGYYGHFLVGPDGVSKVHGQPEGGESELFLLEYRGAPENLKAIIDEYRALYGTQLAFGLYDWQGQAF